MKSEGNRRRISLFPARQFRFKNGLPGFDPLLNLVKKMLEGKTSKAPAQTHLHAQNDAPPRGAFCRFTRAPTFADFRFGVDPTLVSPAAKSIATKPIARSCRDQIDHTGSRAPKSAVSATRSRGVLAELQRSCSDPPYN